MRVVFEVSRISVDLACAFWPKRAPGMHTRSASIQPSARANIDMCRSGYRWMSRRATPFVTESASTGVGLGGASGTVQE